MEGKAMEISAIIGALYVLGWAIAYITPTETDNKWMAKISKLVSKMCFITGLDMNRGIKKYGPKK